MQFANVVKIIYDLKKLFVISDFYTKFLQYESHYINCMSYIL
ncbi:16824_t:CDS:2 [Gigaspora margarita]|uniref:16824_t:CDS:1 n=1 Tax=Gigaspora margarita TaxID=4874 RepID=A0ABN7UR69_GIGMA|nr:16824_t:CDS:2 [Gigaspora margarita]